MSEKKKVLRLFGIIGIELFLIFMVVWFFDPFYQYHTPFGERQAVLFDRDNQMPGSIRNFTYDSVLIGSSVVENCDSTILDGKYGCDTQKVIKASGSTADLLYYLEMAQENRELKNVFYGVDMPALNSDPKPTLYGEDIPRYLHTEALIDDGTYIFNKDILMETIPKVLAYEMQGRNVGGDAYNWASGKEFSAAMAMRAYNKPAEELPTQDFTQNLDKISENIENLAKQIESHPDTMYRFFFPPYSMSWWDCAYVNGQLEEQFYMLEQVIPVLLSYENVEVYYYQDEEEVICNLDNYMDLVHYSPAINQYMLEQLCSGEGKLTRENWEEKIAGMRELVERIKSELIYTYY